MGANATFIAGLITDVAPSFDPVKVALAADWLAAHSVIAVGSVTDADVSALIDALKTGTLAQKITTLRTTFKALAERA